MENIWFLPNAHLTTLYAQIGINNHVKKHLDKEVRKTSNTSVYSGRKLIHALCNMSNILFVSIIAHP